MASFFGKLKGSAISSSAGGLSPSKKDHSGQNLSPLERLLEGAGPLRDDGGDKYFGMENFGNTCYCNSIIQCLYHSLPFRQHVVQHTVPSAAPTLPSPPNGIPKLQLRTQTGPNGSLSPLSPTAKAHSPATATSPARRSAGVPIGAGQGGIRPEDRPDTSEFKKKQAMLAGPILTLDYDHSDSYGMSESLFTCLKGIFEAMAAHPSRLGVVSPQRFLETLKRENEMYRGLIHQDAHEFFNLLLNEVITGVEVHSKEQKSADQGPAKALSMAASSITGAMLKQMAHDNTDTRPRSRWVHDLFEGTLTSETKCLTCENTSSRDEAFLDLSVDLEHHSSVTSCLRKFSQEEMLCERNKFHCDNCGGLQEAEKRMKIKRLPRILALHLKRFKYEDQDHQQLQKLFHRVVYPFHLRLFNTTDEAEDPDRLYELYAVVVHIGAGPLQGHYVSVIKTPDRGWLLFDDELVEPVDRSYVWNFFGGRSGSACAYVLFYQETTMEVVEREQEAEFLASMAKKTATATPTASNLPKVPAAVSPIVEKENRPVMTTTTPPPPPLFGPSANREPNGALLTTTSTGTNLSPTKGLVLTSTNSILPTTKTPITNGAHINVQPPTPLSSQQQQQYQQQHQQQPQPQTSPQPQPQPQPQHTLHHSISRASLGYHHLRKKMLSSFHSGKDSKDSKDSKESKGT